MGLIPDGNDLIAEIPTTSGNASSTVTHLGSGIMGGFINFSRIIDIGNGMVDVTITINNHTMNFQTNMRANNGNGAYIRPHVETMTDHNGVAHYNIYDMAGGALVASFRFPQDGISRYWSVGP